MRQFSRERLRNRNGGAQARSSKDEDDGFRGKAQDEQQSHHQRLAHSGTQEGRRADGKREDRVDAKEPGGGIADGDPREDEREEVAAAPTESEAHLAGQHLEKPRREQRPGTEGRPLLRQHLGLGLAGEQGKGEKDPKNSQYRTGNDRLHYDAIAEPRGQLAHGPAEAMKEPAGAGAKRNDGKRPGEFG